MRVLIGLEHRYKKTPDGKVWTTTNHSYTFFTRYLQVFDEVEVLARVIDVPVCQDDWIRADGPRVRFFPIPHFVGPIECIRKFPALFKRMRAVPQPEALILRVPSLLAVILLRTIAKSGHPFALEVVGDPYDVFAPNGGVNHPLRSFFRYWFAWSLRQQCKRAKAVAYVTQRALQARYPSGAPMIGISDVFLPHCAFATSYSSIELSSGQILATERRKKTGRSGSVLVCVGTLEQLYKAPDVLIKAIALLVSKGFDVRLKWVGDGRYRSDMEQLVRSLDLLDRVTFLGQLPGGNAVQEVLDDADIFVLPSRVEGLPRAMIEAMARGLPCIGSNIGGIPELLENRFLVTPGDVISLAGKIEELITDESLQIEASRRNVLEAQKYRDEDLRTRRNNFYRYVEQSTQLWLTENRTPGQQLAF